MLTPSAYPHIFDNIVNWLRIPRDRRTLLALRRTSKGMRELADNVLFQHAVVVEKDESTTMKPRYGSPGVVVNWGKDDVLPDLEYRILYKILLALLPRSDISRLLIAPLPARAPRNVYALDIKGLPPSWFIDQFKLNRQPLRVIRDIVTTSVALRWSVIPSRMCRKEKMVIMVVGGCLRVG